MAAGGSHHHWSVMSTEQSNYNRIDNIPPEKRFQPGVSGNPAGRPKNSVTTLLKNTDKKTTQKIAEKLTTLAEEGDLKAIDMFIDRTDGKVSGDIPTQDNRSITFVIGDQSLIEGIGKRLNDAIRGDEDTIE